MEYKAPRGTRDILPIDTPKWQWVEEKFRKVCKLYDFYEIRTPTFEHTELFTRNLGDLTDVVSKEMYTFETRGDRSLTLRPEGTAPAMRAYCEHNLGDAKPVVKMYYIARLFRYERPQAGRYREHTQLGIEAVGAEDPAMEAEIISLASEFFKSIGIVDYTLKLNSIGCPKCRPGYRQALLDYVGGRVGELCESCAARYEQNPLRMLDCKNPGCKAVLAGAPKLTDYLCEDCKEHFEKVKKYLDALGIAYVLDPNLVRGFDYYTKTAFEFVSGALGAQNAIGGGGRYDNMVEEIGGKHVPSIGFGLGLDRLMLTLESMGIDVPGDTGLDVFVVAMGDKAREYSVKLLRDLRAAGISADGDYTGRSMKAQMKLAGKYNARYALIVGDNEIDAGEAAVKDMAASEQTNVKFEDLVSFLGK
ncbi:MAG: histidine--tRNA ligase [Abditibacteriota bacterium]|nr:histidine--tRNA ligase [Abditibacteriota bacterium]